MSLKTQGVLRSMKNPLGKSYFQQGLEKLIIHNFTNWKMFRVESERHKYRVSESAEVFAQVHGDLPEICEVYFHNKYLCDIHANLKPDEALAVIQFKLMQELKKGGGSII